MLRHRILAVAVSLFAAVAVSSVYAQADKSAETTEQSEFRQVQAKLAQVRLQLAELELKLANDQNRRDDGLVPQVVIESLELSLAKAKAQLAAMQDSEKDARDALAASAETTVRVARNRLQRLKQFAERSGDVSKSELQRAQMRVEIAELEQQSLKGLMDLPMEQQLRWHIDRINAMIDGLSDRVIVLEDRR